MSMCATSPRPSTCSTAPPPPEPHVILDANVLLYARDTTSPFHQRAKPWLTDQLNGVARVGLPWPSLTAFLRISTHPRASAQPLTTDEAWAQVADWLAAPAAWIPLPTARHADVLGDLVRRHRCSGALVPDAHLAALAIEHGVAVVSADTDFARFSRDVRWVNPLD